MSWKNEWRTIFFPEFASGGLDITRDQVATRILDEFESPDTTVTISGEWSGTNVTVTKETTSPLNGEGSMSVAVAGGAGSVYKALDRAKFGYPFPGHNGIRIRYVKFRCTTDSGSNEDIRVTFGDASDANHYRYWTKTVGASKYVEYVVDMDPDNEESNPAPTEGATTFDPETIDRFGFTNLTSGSTYLFDDIEFIYEYSLMDLVGFPTEAPVDMGDIYGSLHARINGLWANVKALEGKTEQYIKQGIASMEVGQPGSWALELLSDFAPPTTTEITPGNYTINRVRHNTTTEIVSSTGASESVGTIYASYTPEEDNWTEGDLLKVTFSSGYVETDEEPTEVLTANAASGQAVVAVDNAYQWQVGWRVRIYDDSPDTEYLTILELTTPTTITMSTNLVNDYTTAANAGMTRVIQTELTTAVFFTRISREPTQEEFGRNWWLSDKDTGDVADATADTERWVSEVIRGAAEASEADINTTTAGKIYILADPDGTPVATGYGVRRAQTSLSRFFSVIVDDEVTWAGLDTNSGFSNLVVTKGSAYDANNYVRVGREQSSTQNRITAESKFGGGAASTTNVAVTDDALAFKIDRIGNIWRTYYSTTEFTDYQWVLVAEFEDTSGDMTEETSFILESYSPGDADAQTVQSDFDNFWYQLNSEFLEQIYGEAQILPIVSQQQDPRVDQNTATGIEIFRVGLINANNGLPTTGEIAPGTTLVDRFREGTDSDWTNQAGETITNAEALGYIQALYDFPNATWKPGDQARFTLQTVTVTDVVTSRVVTLPDLTIYMIVGGPPNLDETQNLWLGDQLGNKTDTTVPDPSATASLMGYTKALEARGMGIIKGTVTAEVGASETTEFYSTDLIGFGNDYFNEEFSLQIVFTTDGGAPLGETREITDYVTADGHFVVGTVFSANVNTGDKFVILHKTQLLLIPTIDTSDPVDMTAEVPDHSVLAHMLTDDGDTSNYDRRNMSLEAIANALGIVIPAGTGFEGDATGASLYETIVAKEFVTTGAGTTTTVVSTALTEANDYWNGQVLIVIDGSAAGQVASIVDFDAGTDTLTIRPATTVAIGNGAVCVILQRQAPEVPTADTTENYQPRDVVGNKSDTAGVAADQASIMRILRGILAALSINAAAGGEFEIDGVPDLWDALVLDSSTDASITSTTGNRDGAIIERLAAIDAYLGGVDGGGAGFEDDGSGMDVYHALIAYEGVTTGAGDTTSIIDTGLGGYAADYWNGSLVMMVTGTARGSVRTIVDFDGTSDLTVEPAMPGASGSGSLYVILAGKCADWICGANNADNAYDSTNVVGNADGSILEREEYIQTQLGYGVLEIEADAGSDADTIIDAAALTQGTDDWWKGALLLSINGVNEGQARPVVSFSQAADSLEVYPAFLGAPNAGDDFLLISAWRPWVWDQQPDVPVNINAINASETDVFDLNDSISSYIINSLRIKCADPGANTVAVKLYELINDVSVNVQTFTIDTNNFGNYHSLMDMFGQQQLSGDDLQVTVQASAGGPYAVTGQYHYAISKNG